MQKILSLLGIWSVYQKPNDQYGLKKFKTGWKMTKIDPKMMKIRQIDRNNQKVRTLLQNSFSGQKTGDFPLKSFFWSPNLLGSSFPASHTICTSAYRGA